MRSVVNIAFLFIISLSVAGQDTIITISPSMKLQEVPVLPLNDINGWFFKMGNDATWASKDLDMTGWRKLKPSELTDKLADKNGKLECWFRIKIRLDSSFKNVPMTSLILNWAATDLYVDGILIHRFGNTGTNGEPFHEFSPYYNLPVPLNLESQKEYVLAFHFVDFVSGFPTYELKSAYWLKYFFALAYPEATPQYLSFHLKNRFYRAMWLWINGVLTFLFWLLAFQNRSEKNILLIAITSTLFTLTIYTDQYVPTPGASYSMRAIFQIAWSILGSMSIVLTIVLLLRVFKRKITPLLKVLLGGILVCGIIGIFHLSAATLIAQTASVILIYSYYIITSWKTLRGAQWAVLTGVLSSMVFGLSLAITSQLSPSSYSSILLLYTGLFISFPLSLMVYVAMRFKEIIKDVRDNAKRVVQLSEEKKEAAIQQQKLLEEEVARQTVELRNSLENLRATQSQLIQQEKMASLGELTAGIAHEIQNPLNFVNNFSEVNTELVDELKSELAVGNLQSANEIADNIKDNEQKISHHGKRADSIVKGMLQHSRASSGQKEPTDLNALADEYLRLAYQGFRAKDRSFNAKFETDLDPTIEKIKVVPQDIGRVLLNLINNAFYAVHEKKQQMDGAYDPIVSISTRELDGKVEIRVKDNGNGIPQKVVDKIFQPFFTTKPTGQGTGLGLSLSYDIVKAHGGEIKVQTQEGEGTNFTLSIPAHST
jgi:two-component system, NtrC family, sensor kinase